MTCQGYVASGRTSMGMGILSWTLSSGDDELTTTHRLDALKQVCV